MQQYNRIKDEYKDCLLMFRLGDFYELFFDDALTASRELELTLTGRNCGLEERAPMCGVPYHSADSYISRLVDKGYKVAVCEQMTDPAESSGIVEREVIRVHTPGTCDITGVGNESDNLYISSVFVSSKASAIAYADVTTGEFFVCDFSGEGATDSMISELENISPKELIYPEDLEPEFLSRGQSRFEGVYLSGLDASYFKPGSSEDAIKRQFEVASLIPLGIDGREEITIAAGSLLLYLSDTQKQAPSQFKKLTFKNPSDTMMIDRSTMRNLELLETVYDKKVKGSLLGVLDKTKTAMGGRLLKRILKEPLKDPIKINDRLDAVEAILKDPTLRNSLTSSLDRIYDFARLTARVASMRANGKDLIALKNTLAALPELKSYLSSLDSDLLRRIDSDIHDFYELHKMIDEAIVEEPPFILTEGGLIKPGYFAELDDLKASIADAKKWIVGLEAHEKERTGIKTLKVGYNKVFGYYIDVSKSNIGRVPEEYIRKQTLVNNERYITPELKEKESLVLSAEAKINAMEYDLFKQLRSSIEPYIEQLQETSGAIALLDVLVSFASVAYSNGYVKPAVNDSGKMNIVGGRHPAVEQILTEGMFVPNDTNMEQGTRSMLIITGPNMSGKSTYMRQTAIIVLMAQIGSFVPCEKAEIGVTDRIFTRIGASDNLSYGQSTFFIEMSELAGILRNATEKSLIILDEIGRGTSTFDGLSIAWATVDYLCAEHRKIRTMFATHYHELTVLGEKYDNIRNLSVAVSETGKDIVFLHKIVDGPASKSYGIFVARIAGVPSEIRKNAQIKLSELESQSLTDPAEKQLSIFESLTSQIETPSQEYAPYGESTEEIMDLLDELKALDINDMTPIQALNTLQELQSEIKDKEYR